MISPTTPPPTTAPAAQTAPTARPRFPWPILLCVWLLAFLMSTLVTFLLPESFTSTARIRVERDHSDIPGMIDSAVGTAYDPYFVQTEFELLRAELILGKVINKLDLNHRWAPKLLGQPGRTLKTEETLTFLRAHLSLNTVRNTSIIEISVTLPTAIEGANAADMAARLANEIAETYRDYRHEQRTHMLESSIAQLNRAYDENRQQINSLQAQLRERSQTQSLSLTNQAEDTEKRLAELQRFNDLLLAKIAATKTDRLLPANGMVQVIEHAVASANPVFPNKPLNIALGVSVGAVAGLFLSTVVYALQWWAYRCTQATARKGFPPRFRAAVHILNALGVGLVLGYLIATPIGWDTLVGIPLVVLLCGGISAYIEFAHPHPDSVRD